MPTIVHAPRAQHHSTTTTRGSSLGLSQVQSVEAGSLLERQRRPSGWAKEALSQDPHLVLNLAQLPAGVTKLQKVTAVTLVVPHTCRDPPPGVPAPDPDVQDVRASPSLTIGDTQSHPFLTHRTQVEDLQSHSTMPSSASALLPSARKGMTGAHPHAHTSTCTSTRPCHRTSRPHPTQVRRLRSCCRANSTRRLDGALLLDAIPQPTCP